MQRLRIAGVSIAVVQLLSVGCMMDTGLDGEEDVKAVVSAVQHGEVVDPTWEEAEVDLFMCNVNNCYPFSGTLIRNDIVLTAGHCFQTDDAGSTACTNNPGCPPPDFGPEHVIVYQKSSGGVTYGLAGQYARHPNADVAMLKLQQPFSVNGKTTGHNMQIYYATGHEIIGEGLDQSGWGFAIETPTPDGCSVNMDISNTELRRQENTELVAAKTGYGNKYHRFELGSDTHPESRAVIGDSGSSYRYSGVSSFFNEPIVGVASYEDLRPQCLNSNYATASSIFEDWAAHWLHTFMAGSTAYKGYGNFTAVPFSEMYEVSTPDGGEANWAPSSRSVTETTNNSKTMALVSDPYIYQHYYFRAYLQSNDNDWQGLVANYRDDCNYYVFEISEQEARARLRMVRECSSMTLDEVAMPGFDWGPGHWVLIKASGEHLYGKLNSEYIFDYHFTPSSTPATQHDMLTSGRPGLYTSWQQNALFRSMALYRMSWCCGPCCGEPDCYCER